MKYVPKLDPDFSPIVLKLREYEEKVSKATQKQKLVICLERNKGYNYRYELDVFADNTGFDEENYEIVERIVKSLLWIAGGYKIYIAGSDYLYERLKADYAKGGNREFDALFMSHVYENEFTVLKADYHEVPPLNQEVIVLEKDLSGCRIGFDAGGSDRKVAAVIDGEVVYSEEVVWYPKINSDPEYHREHIMEAMRTAASHMPRVDAIGVSSAGIYVDNRVMMASLFLKVPNELYDAKVKNMYIDIVRTFGADIPFRVANDGDVAALAGAMELNDTQILGIAMGTSEAAGYTNENGNLTGWLNELAFVPVDFNKDSMIDEWSGDVGCGVKYFSQDGVIKLAEAGGYRFKRDLSPAQKLKEIQKLNDAGDALAERVFADIGIYLGYTIAYYARFYNLKHVLLLGRVTSGKGGNLIREWAEKTLYDEFPEHRHIKFHLPEEKNRRVGQAIAAASLPSLKR